MNLTANAEHSPYTFHNMKGHWAHIVCGTGKYMSFILIQQHMSAKYTAKIQ